MIDNISGASSPDKQSNTLYHYCSLDTFHKIISSKSIWLTDISKSNDSAEHKWLLLECGRWLQDNSSSAYVPVIINDLETNKETISWVFCLSGKEDSLSQWRGYADDGCGMSIGFKKEYLDSIAESPPQEEIDKIIPFIRLDRIQYLSAENGLVEKFGLDAIENPTTHKPDGEKLSHALVSAKLKPPVYKNPSFAEENEWRIHIDAFFDPNKKSKEDYIGLLDINNHDKVDKCHLGDIGFFIRNNRIVSYVPLEFLNIREAISKITIGPKANLDKDDVLRILVFMGVIDDFNNCPFEIIKSKSTYQ
jgi:hypothetical protein